MCQEALYDLVRQAITSETEKFKSQLVSLCEKYESVHQLLERQSRKQENIQETIVRSVFLGHKDYQCT